MDERDLAIVIGREYGSGGRAVGRALADTLGVPFYDRRLIAEAAGSMGYRVELCSRLDECKPSPLRSFLTLSLGAFAAEPSGYSQQERIYCGQAAAIRDIASRGGCVIMGRTADYVLREHTGLLSVFLCADMVDRVGRIRRADPSLSEQGARDAALRCDRRRAEYYNYFTGRRWGVASTYDICLNTSRTGEDGAVSLILGMARSMAALLTADSYTAAAKELRAD